MSEKEPINVNKAARGVSFEERENPLKLSLRIEPGIYPIVKSTIANFRNYPLVLCEAMQQDETGTSRRYEVSSIYSFPLDFIQQEISGSVAAFFDYIDMGQSRVESAFNTRQNYSRVEMEKHYGQYYAANKERIQRELFEA